MKNKLVIILSVSISLILTGMLVFSVFSNVSFMGEENNPHPPPYSDIKDSDNEHQTDATDTDDPNPDNSQEKNTPSERVEVKTVTFAAVGDNLIHSSIYEDARLLAKNTDKEFDFLPMYEYVRDVIESSDLSFVNQEGPIAGESFGYSGYPLFNAPNEIGDALIEVGFDIVNLANNHMLDKGERGYAASVNFWEDKPVITIGGHLSKEDYERIRVVEKNGIKIAFLSYTYGTNGLMLSSQSPYIIPWADSEEIIPQIKKAKNLAELVFVSIHWGNEDQFKPTTQQTELAKEMAEAGADVILGHHSHVLQPIEWIEKDNGGKTLVAYSLGNFISTMQYSRNMVGGILTFDIIKIAQEKPIIDNVEFIPTMTHYNRSIRGLKIYPFSDYTQELESNHGAHKFDSRMSMSYMENIIYDAIPIDMLNKSGLLSKNQIRNQQ